VTGHLQFLLCNFSFLLQLLTYFLLLWSPFLFIFRRCRNSRYLHWAELHSPHIST